MRLFVKKNDTVLILAGKDKGKRGKVLKVQAREGTIIVEKVNMIKRQAAIPACRVMVVCPECHSPARIGHAVAEGGARHRVCKKCHGTLA